MRLSALIVILLGSFVLLPCRLYAADTSFRCGNTLVSLGDTMYKIRRECGDPLYEQQVGEKRSYKIYGTAQLKTEAITYITEWVYAKNQGEYILTFEGSRLVHKEFSRD